MEKLKFNFKSKINNLYEIPTQKIKINKSTKRSEDTYELGLLAESMRTNGVLQPLTVTQNDKGEYILVSGERRLIAARLGGIHTLPCLVIKPKDQSLLQSLSLIENTHRKPLDMFLEAEEIASLLETHGMSPIELAERLCLNPNALNERLKILRLTPEQRKTTCDAGLNIRQVRAVVEISDDLQRAKALDLIIDHSLKMKDSDKNIKAAATPEKPVHTTTPAVFCDIRVLRNSFKKMEETAKKSGYEISLTERENEEDYEFSFKIQKR